MIEIQGNELAQYFNEEVIEGINEYIDQEIQSNIYVLPKTGIGCNCFPDIPIKQGGFQNLYVEYTYEVLGNLNQLPIPIRIGYLCFVLFVGPPPKMVNDKIEKVKSLISNYTRMN